MQYTLFLLMLITFAISFWSVDTIRQAFKQQFIDIPNERSSHTQPTPRGGGVGFIIASAVAILLSQLIAKDIISKEQILLLFSLLPLVIVGIIDDRKSVSASVRYVIQILVSTLVVLQCDAFPQPWLNQLGLWGHLLAILLTVIGMTALINFYNFMDGLDGLVAGVAVVQLGFLATWINIPILWIFLAALLGFLCWNWSPAKIFMGDAGSTTIGATIAVSLLYNHHAPIHTWSVLAITLPLVGDAIYTIICRILRQENIFSAHRSHLYQRLNQSGWSHAQVASLYIAITFLIGVSLELLGAVGAGLALGGVIPTIWVTELYLDRHHNQLTILSESLSLPQLSSKK